MNMELKMKDRAIKLVLRGGGYLWEGEDEGKR
jgi:hypothetical protein